MKYINAKYSRRKEPSEFDNRFRRLFLMTLFFIASLGLIGRAVYWQHDPRLESASKDNARYLQTNKIPAYRGSIMDRNGILLATSAPADSAWIDPSEFDNKHITAIAEVVKIDADELRAKVAAAKDKQHLYLKRYIKPQIADDLRALKIDGLYLDLVDKRFYPAGEITAHIVGSTDVDGKGVEGIEMQADEHLRATPGSKQIMIDAKRNRVHDIKLLKEPKNGENLTLSIDQRVQYDAYRVLRNAIAKHKAESGSVVVVNAQTGEIIAAVNYPSFNPNGRRYNFADRHRNRLVTDTFELGSTIKPIIMAAAIDGGYLQENTVIDTSPGYYRMTGGKQIRDIQNYGKLNITSVIVKSSNVAISKIAQRVPREVLWKYLFDVGFGETPGTIFPGEVIGKLRYHDKWSPTDHAVISYGYGVSVSLLQLAMAYTTFANDGWRPNPTFLKDNPYFRKRQVFNPETARSIRQMLHSAISKEGTGSLAKVKGFTTAGKTGTTRKSVEDKGDNNEYTSVFAGFAPLQQPNFVCVVVIDKPSAGEYYGGRVAAPVFSKVMSATLRFMNFNYDELPDLNRSNALLSTKHVN